MKRDLHGSEEYWNKWIFFSESSIQESWARLKQPPGNPAYRPQYAFELVKDHYELMLRRYSRGDAVSELAQYFPPLLAAWEEAERLGKDVWSEEVQYMRHAWAVNLDHYIRCFWLTGLALALEISDDLWQRLLVLMGNEGEDVLLDRVIASRQPDRRIGEKLCFPKAYQKLFDVIESPVEQRQKRLRSYLERWFVSLKNAGSPEFPRDFRTPSWWDFCANEDIGMKGAYFGCWCIEVAAVAKAFGIDDTLCLDHPNYPGDLIQDGRCPRYPDPVPPSGPDMRKIEFGTTSKSKPPRHWLSRLLLGPGKLK